MSVQPGATIGPYTVDREIGRGGMGVVYLGHDTRLDRAVAIKALPEHLATAPDRLARFEREARALASLSHPNVAGIYGVEDHENSRYLILEYVDGETLEERLDRGPISSDEAIDIALQIAAGLEAAHDAGVVHRDLKPGNIKITPDGQVKVLDFGLARSAEGVSSTGSSEIPTLTTPPSPTMAGAVLGTAPYMSPEQARGRRVDQRTDIWSFGVVLYEMLTGIGPFRGETISDSIGAILHKEVDLSLLPDDTPRMMRHALVRCLARDRNERWRSVADVAIELREARNSGPDTVSEVGRTRALRMATVTATIALLIACGLGAAFIMREPPTPGVEVRRTFQIALLPGADLNFGDPGRSFALSPSGDRLVVVADIGEESGLWIRDIALDAAVLLPGTRGASQPVFSPSGDWIAYFTDNGLWKIASSGGSPQQLAEANSSHRGVAWIDEQRLVFAPDTTSALHTVSAAGGQSTPLTSLHGESGSDRSRSHRWPAASPDGRLVVYTAQRAGQGFDTTSIEAVDIETGRSTTLLSGVGSFPQILSDGTLIFAGRNAVYAVAVDWSIPRVLGTPRPVLNDVLHSVLNGGASIAFTDDGVAIFTKGASPEGVVGVPSWLDLKTGEIQPIPAGSGPMASPRISADGARFAWHTSNASSAGGIVIFEFARGIRTEISTNGPPANPVWSPDGQTIAFSAATESSQGGLYAVRIDGESPPAPMGIGNGMYEQFPMDWNPHDGSIIYMEWSDDEAFQLMGAFPEGDGWRTEPVLATPAMEAGARLSPDGQWMAYTSNISGDWEVYIRSLQGPPRRRQISVGGGRDPMWAPSGDRVYYITWVSGSGYSADLKVVELEQREGNLEPGLPQTLHEVTFASIPTPSALIDLHPDGDRFLIVAPTDSGKRQESPIQTFVITGWHELVQAALSDAPVDSN